MHNFSSTVLLVLLPLYPAEGMKSALVLGASRGMGRQIALTLGKNGYNVGVAAKTTEDSEKLPGTIYSVSEEVEKYGVKALPIKCDVRVVSDVDFAVNEAIKEFGELDLAIYNAAAMHWEPVVDTPMKRFDLMHEVNTRGAYGMIQTVLPYFLKRRKGRIILVAPPIYNRFFKGKTACAMTKVGMTVMVHGLANELKGTGVSVSALWPATVTESHVTKVKNVSQSLSRNPCLFAEACLVIGNENTEKYNGRALIDEDLMRENGMTDFTKYRSNPDVEPPRMMPRQFPSLRVAEEDEDLMSKL